MAKKQEPEPDAVLSAEEYLVRLAKAHDINQAQLATLRERYVGNENAQELFLLYDEIADEMERAHQAHVSAIELASAKLYSIQGQKLERARHRLTLSSTDTSGSAWSQIRRGLEGVPGWSRTTVLVLGAVIGISISLGVMGILRWAM